MAKVEFKIHIATKDGFPDATTATDKAIEIYNGVCRKYGKDSDITRFREDLLYQEWIVGIVSSCRLSSPSSPPPLTLAIL